MQDEESIPDDLPRSLPSAVPAVVASPVPMPADEQDRMSDRLVVSGFCYHQQADQDPTSVSSGWERKLLTSEQPFRRRCKVGEDWTPLEHGWLAHASLLLIENNEGQQLTVQPSDEERQVTADKIVDVAVQLENEQFPAVVPFTFVLPGEDVRLQPIDLSRILIRCRRGVAVVSIALFPQ